MHILVLRQAVTAVDEAAKTLVAVLDISLYEAKVLLNAMAPRIISIYADGALAQQHAKTLCEKGVPTIVIPKEWIETEQKRVALDTLLFEPDRVIATLRNGHQRSVRYSDIKLLLRGMRSSLHTTEVEETATKFDLGRAVLTGGMLVTKTEKTTSTVTTAQRHAFFHIYESSDLPPLVVFEQRLNYSFLGPALQPSSFTNFLTVIDMFRKRAPQALYDDRLLKVPNVGHIPLASRGIDPEEWKVDVAACVLRYSLA